MVLTLAACDGASTVTYPPDDITPPEGVIETTAPLGMTEPLVVAGPLNEDAITFLIHSYLPDNLIGPGSGGQMYCAHEMYGWERAIDTAVAWLWAYCEEFGFEAEEGSATSTPVAVHMAELPEGWVVSFMEEPQMGSLYADSVREMFPPELADRALQIGSSRNLAAEVEDAARNRNG